MKRYVKAMGVVVLLGWATALPARTPQPIQRSRSPHLSITPLRAFSHTQFDKPLPKKDKPLFPAVLRATDRAPHPHAAPPISLSPFTQVRQEIGDSVFYLDVQSPTGDNQILGVEFDGTYFWVTGGNSGSDPNKLYQLDPQGNLIATYDQPTSSTGWGFRDLAFDGTYLYGSPDDGNIYQIDPTTGQWTGVVIPGPVAPCRALAYDPATDHFWTANWDSPIYEIDRNGNIVNTYANSYDIYGMAWDNISPGGPYLWVSAQVQNSAGAYNIIYQFDPQTGTYTGVSFEVPYGGTDGYAGGLCFTTDWDASMGVLFEVVQMTPDAIFGFFVTQAGEPGDPLPPTDITAYSDYTTPTSIQLMWTDPTHYVNGDTLTQFHIAIASSDTVLIDTVSAGVEAYTVTGLTDGQLYTFLLQAVDANDSASVWVSSPPWYAGGSPYPAPPENLSVSSIGDTMMVLTWTDPSTQSDGTPLDDFAGIYVYSNDVVVDSVAPGVQIDTLTLSPGYYVFYVTAYDNETPRHESDPSNSVSWFLATQTFDFESHPGPFSPTPETGAWEWGVPTSGPGNAHSGINLWATNLEGEYVDNADWRLEGGPFIATSDNVALGFWQWYDIETGWDGGNVKISTDGGNTWTLVEPTSGYTGTASSGNAGIPGEPCFTGHPQQWEFVTFDLSPYVSAGTIFYIRFHFGSDGSVTYPGWYIDDVAFAGAQRLVPEHDIGVLSIETPASNSLWLPGDTLTPTATYVNTGQNTESFFAICTIFINDLGTQQIYHDSVLVSSLMPDSIITVTFPSFILSNIGAYTATFTHNLPNDGLPDNDVRSTNFVVVESYVDFEENNGGFNATGGWAWGAPVYGPGSAHSGVNVWGTVLTGEYSNNANWTLDGSFVANSATPVFGFWHWYDIETMWDGGNVKISTNGGLTWQIITPEDGYDGTASSSNAGIPGEPCFTGHPAEWQVEIFDLSPYVNPGDTFLIRWHFGSDGSITYPGWYIDDAFGVGVNLVTVMEQPVPHPRRFAIQSITPNPAMTRRLTIVYELPQRASVHVDLYDLSGRRVFTWTSRPQPPGVHQFMLDLRPYHLSAGVYFVRLESAGQHILRKIVLLR